LCHTGRARPAANRKVGAGDAAKCAALMAKEMLIHEEGLVALEALGRARCLDDGRWMG
jgi:hypothetical protein